jgi:deoxyribose-phosphate aldolase
MTQNTMLLATSTELASRIDHTLLKPTLTESELRQLCQEAATHRFKTVCVPPTFVAFCVNELRGTSVGTITVVGFPLGYSTGDAKAFEARQAIEAGASEIDMVINIAWAKAHRFSDLEAEVRTVAETCQKAGAHVPLKVILETAYLTDEEKQKAALAAERGGATFVKTSTGFATGVPVTGATLADIRLLRETLKPSTLIKASGGIRDLAFARELIAAGADRLGTSSGVSILKGLTVENGY